MGFIVPYATRLTIIIGILVVALRELCIFLMEMLGLYREACCNGGSTADASASDVETFQYPYMTMNFNGTDFYLHASDARASLAPFLYEGAAECGKEVNARCGRTQSSALEGSSMDCSVCLCEFEHGQQVQITPNCCHVFHSECIYKWLDQDQKTCPLCRTSLVVAPM